MDERKSNSPSLKPFGLRFYTANDGRDFARECVEDSNRWLAAHNVSRANDYFHGKTDLHIHIATRPHSCKLHLVSRLVHFEGDFDRSFGVQSVGVHNEVRNAKADGEYALVFDWTGQMVKSPQNVVAAIVGLEAFDEVNQSWVDFLAIPIDRVLKIFNALPEWEMRFRDICRAKQQGAVAYGLIKCMAKVGNYSVAEQPSQIGDRATEFDLDDLFPGLFIHCREIGAFASLNEALANRVQLGDVFYSAIDE
jgi:hypothetical protein